MTVMRGVDSGAEGAEKSRVQWMNRVLTWHGDRRFLRRSQLGGSGQLRSAGVYCMNACSRERNCLIESWKRGMAI